MPTRISLVLIVVGVLCATVSAQDSGHLTREFVYRQMLSFPALIEGGHINPHWFTDGSSFWYPEGPPERTNILTVDPKTGSVAPLFDVPRLRAALEDALGYRPPYEGVPFRTLLVEEGARAVKFSVDGRFFRIDLNTYEVSPHSPGIQAQSTQNCVTPRGRRMDRIY